MFPGDDIPRVDKTFLLGNLDYDEAANVRVDRLAKLHYAECIIEAVPAGGCTSRLGPQHGQDSALLEKVLTFLAFSDIVAY
jgi:hypothetical protein